MCSLFTEHTVDYNRFFDKRWALKHDMASESIILLAMDSLGDIHHKTLEFLKQVSDVMAQRDRLINGTIMITDLMFVWLSLIRSRYWKSYKITLRTSEKLNAGESSSSPAENNLVSL